MVQTKHSSVFLRMLCVIYSHRPAHTASAVRVLDNSWRYDLDVQ